MRKPALLACLSLAALITTPAFAQDIKLASNVPYTEDNEISDAIKAECSLGNKLADSIKRHDGSVVLVDGVPDTASGRVLQLEIVDSVNMGNAFMGRQTYTKIKGSLWQDGARVAGFKARRNSMGGAFAGFKGACSVLGRTVEKLGEDVGGWLKSPKDGAALGD
ncbi:hypothetical protein [Pseudoxanthomonas indica]|uniref:Uncharacterized protein n=1 Tax=Pseudoxanthomonas indica TaxID=428993 RepID=A0A1T5KGH3_9GAMM|nr:hypothetical protein [Pseudoxanthomonas indica]GGD49137.1 hypothetical protein GCM10007235_21260 [Pseudoxanthomonas indica]SKC62555.1 hypothetical protein SAMN06296058_1674 [Pseudoxanthomonas indica]